MKHKHCKDYFVTLDKVGLLPEKCNIADFKEAGIVLIDQQGEDLEMTLSNQVSRVYLRRLR